jgi:cyclic pyranopterin phosphate synthase
MKSQPISLVDTFDRRIRYLRLSVTDRCDFRCQYCMTEEMRFLPRKSVLSADEIIRLASLFVDLGVEKIRLTGGEPLIRPDIVDIAKGLSAIDGLHELVMTTNGSQLSTLAKPLVDAGVSRVNVSLDTLCSEQFSELSRTGDLKQVLEGLDAAVAAGFKRIRLNTVLLTGQNDSQIEPLIDFALDKGIDIAFIEEMPMGHITQTDRELSLVPSAQVLQTIRRRFGLVPILGSATDGPARRYSVEGTSTEVGVISPITDNFCDACNRLRVTPDGRLILCLGHENSLDLRQMLRSDMDSSSLKRAIVAALAYKPERHVFDQPDEPQVVRLMNATGG